MSELKTPSIEMVMKVFEKEGLASRGELKSAAEATVRAFREKFDPESHPVCAVLGERAFNEVCNANYDLVAAGVPMEKRLDHVTALLDERLKERMMIGDRKGAILDREWMREARERKIAPDSEKAIIAKLSGLGSWFEYIKKWIKIETKHYSSVRYASASGTSGSGWRKKWRTLRVVATTHGTNVTAKLFWFPISSKTVLSTFVVSSHFRAPWGLIPTSASPLIAGAVRNGTIKSNSSNSWIVSKAAVYIDSDPNLQNLTYFGQSNDAGIQLNASGTP